MRRPLSLVTLCVLVVLSLFNLGEVQEFVAAQIEDNSPVTKTVTLIAGQTTVDVAPDNALHPGGIKYNAFVFNGTIPGPVISVDQGDTLKITIKNEGELFHSFKIQAGNGPSEAAGSGTLRPGESKTWSLGADTPGAFLYYGGGLNGVWEQVANGMYGAIIVHPANEKPAKEFYVVFSELYNTADQGLFTGANATGSFDIIKFVTGQPDLVLTNGMAHKYMTAIGAIVQLDLNPNAEVFKVRPDELTRWYIVNAGPRGYVAFSFMNGMISAREGVIRDRLGTQLVNDETWTIPPGSASVIETVFPEEGIYVGYDHDLGNLLKGGAFAVVASNNSTDTDHPVGTWVPPKGSSSVSGPGESSINIRSID
jgi:nitrite reductase (NO-forming)